MKILFTSAALGALACGAALSQDGEIRQLGAHVHGEARLSVAIDPSGLALAELTGAAWNFYGFEAAPLTEAQRQTMDEVRSALSAEGLIAWPQRAGCDLEEITVNAMLSGGADEVNHDHDHGHGDEHGDAYDEHDHAPSHHDHQASEHESGRHGHDDEAAAHAHNDVTVSWTWRCARVEAADRFDAAALFDALPRLEQIEAEAFDGRRAAVGTLSPDAAGLRLQ